MTYKPHTLAEAFPIMEGEPFDDLVKSIKQHGLIEPIIVQDSTIIIDGRNRLRACKQAGVAPRFEEYTSKKVSVQDYIWIKNVDRRHLTTDQRVAVVLKWEKYERKQAQQRLSDAGKQYGRGKPRAKSPEAIKSSDGRVREALAERAKSSAYKVRQAKTVQEHDKKHGTKLLEQVHKGEKTMRQAEKEAIFARPARRFKRQKNVDFPWGMKHELNGVRYSLEQRFSRCPSKHKEEFRQGVLKIVNEL